MNPRRPTAPKAAKPSPDGSETMKRRSPQHLSLRPAKYEFDPKRAYTPEQLADIGAIALKWNQIEAHIDFVGSQILFAKTPFWLRLATDKVMGERTKLKLLRECAARGELLNDRAKSAISSCFTQIDQCRSYRNAIVHHHIYDHEKGIGSYIDESNSPYQILVSLDALSTLYKIMCFLLEELREIDLLFRIETDAQRPGRMDERTREFIPFSIEDLRTKIVPDQTKRLEALQRKRKALPKLPKFPDADLVRELNSKDDSD
ncbi:hypothetical protein [Phenylobacterium montanum]|uniref:Uncharacterized protein n=1 Tax=Phenylobacterium montanum TaxID=2823693 RepID=A0A975IWQ9_9CAUL|nr:hypothetical protein [Caulobacter sp. S6]QUD89849.1 hypothetical protein KCG34_08260 [Caulobacter sp. S6]